MIYFGIGLPKTATSSLQTAFNVLGYKTKHYCTEPEYARIWTNQTHDRPQEFGFINDLPISIRYKELDNHFPDSKFIYTDRDMDEWLNSAKYHWSKKQHITSQNWPDYRMELFGRLDFDADVFRSVYENHKKDAIDYFKNRMYDLLIINITNGDGWEELCEFTGDEIPTRKFPVSNKRN